MPSQLLTTFSSHSVAIIRPIRTTFLLYFLDYVHLYLSAQVLSRTLIPVHGHSIQCCITHNRRPHISSPRDTITSLSQLRSTHFALFSSCSHPGPVFAKILRLICNEKLTLSSLLDAIYASCVTIYLLRSILPTLPLRISMHRASTYCFLRSSVSAHTWSLPDRHERANCVQAHL